MTVEDPSGDAEGAMESVTNVAGSMQAQLKGLTKRSVVAISHDGQDDEEKAGVVDDDGKAVTHDAPDQKYEPLSFDLPKDTYSFFFTSKMNHPPFLFAILVFAFQAAVLIVIQIGMTQSTSNGNRFSVPPGVSRVVRVSQFFALILAPVTQDDFIQSLDSLIVQYDSGVREIFPSASQRDLVSISELCCPSVSKTFTFMFSIDTITKGSGVEEDECNWLLKSPKSSSFDLSAVGSSGWTIWTGVVTPPPVSVFLVSCDECSSEADCNYHGSCSRETKHCICDPGWMGTTCILDDICEEIAAGAAGDSADRLVLLRDETDEIVSLYARPVYYNTYYNVDDGSHNATALFLYLGRRWYDIETPLLPEEVVEYAKPEHFFHAYWDAIYEYNTCFFSQLLKVRRSDWSTTH